MNWLDWALLVILLPIAFFGLRHGLSSMLAAAVILAVAMVAARPLAGMIEGSLDFVSGNYLARMAAVYVALVVLAGIAVALLGSVFKRVLGAFPGGALLNRGVGAVVGIILGLALTSAVLSALAHIVPGAIEPAIAGSAIGGFLTGSFHDAMARLRLALP